MSESNEVTYLADFGDRVMLADGRCATVTRTQPCSTVVTQESGTYYDLMFKGGDEMTVYHWGEADHLTFGHPSRQRTMPLFVVVPDPAPVVDLDREVTQDEVKALVVVEVAERLAAKAHRALTEGNVDEAKRLLEALVDEATTRTVTAVKTQALSDHISQQASAAVRKAVS